ncbi:Zn-dependent hydrolase [Gottschalkia purinilytica]|uniref:Zn-dependent hydrolase n=1 Tax=Gottschalkia purinilytica TaxID=1503 RepID=A0A0L0WAW6_GOTPU|nr:MBL fold metallo-hydrolase [Gottschalkia purinilytica]KNF08597.1 Zn-dependent hydrolase [Gottschalkia purinilytica]
MSPELLHKISNMTMKSEEITKDIILIQFTIVNACIISSPDGWFLVDTGMENSADFIIQVSEEHFGKDSRPKGIILTHGHFDHIGSVIKLTKHWDVPVYAHELEIPYLKGKKDYPKGDSTVGGGMVSLLSPTFPHHSIDLGNRIHPLPSDGSIPEMHDWIWIHTPGHTQGHISLFRKKDRVLIVGDAFTTLKQESMLSVLTQNKEISGPPAYLTTDWNLAEKSVRRLKELDPSLVITSHGLPMKGEELTKHFDMLVKHFKEIAVPEHGRFVD